MNKNPWQHLLAALILLFALTGCSQASAPAETQAPATEAAVTAPTEAPTEPIIEDPVMSYAEFLEAPLNADVTIETYVQGSQTWWNEKITLFCQSPDGAYYLYNLSCSQEDAAKLVPGTKIRVEGYKAAYQDQIEILEGTFSFADGEPFLAEPADLTILMGSDVIKKYANRRFSFTGLTVAPSQTPEGKEAAFLYEQDGSGEEGDHLFFNLTDGTHTIQCSINIYMSGTDEDSEVYQAVQKLKIGAKVDTEGFLQWSQGPVPIVTSLAVVK